jgi:CRP-like cAMP-binding protein
MFMRKAEFDR